MPAVLTVALHMSDRHLDCLVIQQLQAVCNDVVDCTQCMIIIKPAIQKTAK